MTAISKNSTLIEVAALVSGALQNEGIVATLSGGSAVSIYTDNAYQSRDLDFVTAALVEDLARALTPLGFQHTGVPRHCLFEHSLIEWYLDFPAAPLTFGHFYVDHKDCAVIDLATGQLRIITPTHSVMDRLAAAFVWNDAQSREQAILVAANKAVDWAVLRTWFANEGKSEAEFERFQNAVETAKQKK